MDFQSECWAKSRKLGQPCTIFVRGRGAPRSSAAASRAPGRAAAAAHSRHAPASGSSPCFSPAPGQGRCRSAARGGAGREAPWCRRGPAAGSGSAARLRRPGQPPGSAARATKPSCRCSLAPTARPWGSAAAAASRTPRRARRTAGVGPLALGRPGRGRRVDEHADVREGELRPDAVDEQVPLGHLHGDGHHLSTCVGASTAGRPSAAHPTPPPRPRRAPCGSRARCRRALRSRSERGRPPRPAVGVDQLLLPLRERELARKESATGLMPHAPAAPAAGPRPPAQRACPAPGHAAPGAC